MFGKLNIFSTQKCSFQNNLPYKSRENGTKQNFWRLISLIILTP